jgi:hypothetical protein
MLAFHGLTSARQNPSAAWPAIRAHARRPATAEGAGKRRRQWRRRGISAAGAQPLRRRAGGRHRGGSGPGGGGGEGGGGESGRGAASRRCTVSGDAPR